MPEHRPEYHFYDDLSLTPAYVMGYAFHALERVDAATPVHGRRGAVGLLTELLATLTKLKLDASLSAAEPLRHEQEILARSSRSARVGPASAAQVLAVLPLVEASVKAELDLRGIPGRSRSSADMRSYSLRVLVGTTALEWCPDRLRPELIDGCRALDAQLHTAAGFHLYRVRDGLAGSPAARSSTQSTVADPRLDPALRCSRAEVVSLLQEVREMLESLAAGA